MTFAIAFRSPAPLVPWHRQWPNYNPATLSYDRLPDIPREWPPKVWKHYYALPTEIWRDDLIDTLPSPRSGVLLLSQKPGELIRVTCCRRSTPNKEATRIKPGDVMNIARLANLRMWDAYRNAEMAQRDAAYWREQSKAAA